MAHLGSQVKMVAFSPHPSATPVLFIGNLQRGCWADGGVGMDDAEGEEGLLRHTVLLKITSFENA